MIDFAVVRGRGRVLVAIVVFALLCAGCKVDATTTVRLQPDGSGTVSVRVNFDAEAVRLVERGGGRIENRVVLTDLKRAGWTISRWSRSTGGSASVTLSHGFRNGRELAQVMTDLTGANGIVQDVHVTRTRNMFEHRDGLTLTADLSLLRSGVRDDTELASRLRAAGINVDAVDFVLGAQLQRAFSLAVTLALPHNKTHTFRIPAGEKQSVNLSSSKVDWNRVMLTLIGSMMVFLALLLYLSASISARRRRTRALEFAAERAGRESTPLM